MQRRNVIIGGAAVLGLGGWALTRTSKDLPYDPLMAANAQEVVADPAAAAEIPDMVMGAADAPIEIIEYASFTCPHCEHFHSTVFPTLKADYIDTGKVRFVYREVYFDRFGLWASMIARCGGEMRYFGIADMIYNKQQEWTASGDPVVIVEELRKLGKTAGLTDEMLDTCMNDADQAKNLVAWYQENADRDGITGTPSFMIDGEKFSNMSLDEFKKVLDEKLAG